MPLLLPFLFGCAGVLDLSRATPLAPGEVRFQAGTAAGGVEMSSLTAGFRFAAGVHAGVSPGLEVGGGLGAVVLTGPIPFGFSDASIDAKVRLGKEMDSRLHLALNPRVRIGYASPSWSPLSVDLPLLIGLDAGPGQLIAAPRAGLLIAVGELPQERPQFGMSLGWVLPVSEDLELLPAFGVDWTANNDPDETGLDAGVVSVAAGISFIVVIE